MAFYVRAFTTTCPSALIDAINDNVNITPTLVQIINTGDGNSTFDFNASLSAGEETELDNVLAAWVCPPGAEGPDSPVEGQEFDDTLPPDPDVIWSSDKLVNTFVPLTRTVNGTLSITGGGDLTADRNFSLVNDSASPGINKLYGTDGTGTKDWYDQPSGGAGEANTISNIGTSGVGVFKQKTGVDFELKKLHGTTGIATIDDTGNNEIDIALDYMSLPEIHTVEKNADYLVIYDDSSSAYRRVKAQEVGSGGNDDQWKHQTIDRDLTTPPVSPAEHDQYLVASPATGDWTGKEDHLAIWDAGSSSWEFDVPIEGEFTWVYDEDILLHYYGGAWIEFKTNPKDHDHNDLRITHDSDSDFDIIFDANGRNGAPGGSISRDGTSGFLHLMPNSESVQWIAASPSATNGANDFWIDVDNQGVLHLNTLGGAGRYGEIVATHDAPLRPAADGTSNLGTATHKWNELHATTLYGDGSNLTGLETGAVSTVLTGWTLDTGDLYYSDYAHGLGTTDVAVFLYDSVTLKVVEAEDIRITDTNTVRVWVRGNSESIKCNVVTGKGPKGDTGPQGPAGGGATSMDGLSDADTTTVTPNPMDVLCWNGTNWVPDLKKDIRGHTWAISGEIKVASGDTDFILPFFVKLLSGKTARIVSARHIINSGTSATVKITKNDVDVTGFTGISVTTTATTTDPADVAIADDDKLALVVSSVAGTPTNMSFTLFIEYDV